MHAMPIPIAKENVSELHFPIREVLTSTDQITLRNSRLEKALRLGNNSRGKVKIVFEDVLEIRQIEATVWALTEKNISIKGGMMIPINRIHEIKFF